MSLRAAKFTRWCLLILQLCVGTVVASEVNIEFATSSQVEGRYLFDAYINYEFDDEVITALSHGIPLRIDTHIKVKRERRWLWNPVVRAETLSFQLQRLALSDHYLLTNLSTNEKEQFQYLDEALRTLGSINAHFLFDRETINSDSSYVGYLKSELNIEALPPPLRPIAYFSRHWRADSDWYEWLVK